jgi:hypothetical protein
MEVWMLSATQLIPFSAVCTLPPINFEAKVTDVWVSSGFYPDFVALMNQPGATIAKLLEMCVKQTSQWPKKGHFTIYARVYLDVDDEQGSDDAYVGQTRDAARRHMAT